MKKLKFLTLLMATIAIAGTGCLKDKDFDNHEYGINDPDNSPVGVGFTLGTKAVINTGLTLSDQAQALDTASVLVSLLSGNPASTDVHVVIVQDDSLIARYNAANGTNFVQLDPSLYTLNTTVTIPAGKRNAPIQINVPSTTTLDPNINYGLGFRIVSADNGYNIASNENQIVLSIAIRNIYDGDYTSNGYFYHPLVPRAIVDRPKTLATVNATTVELELGDLGPSNYFALFDVDPTPPHHVTVSSAGGAGGTYYQWDDGLPTTSPGPAYTPQWPHSAECNNTYDETSQTFKMRYGYIGGTGFRVSEEFIKRN